jgi:hypothetical protein
MINVLLNRYLLALFAALLFFPTRVHGIRAILVNLHAIPSSSVEMSGSVLLFPIREN